ncbi:MAG: LssY C-terminal domain-containing protein [Patescibacteria group bacterium]
MTPSFWNAQVHDFGFEKATIANTARQRHHARFWKTNIIINGKTAYIGTASFDVGVKMGVTHKIAPDIDTEKEFLFNDLNSSGLIKKYNKQPFVSPTLGKNLAGDEFFTYGESYLIEL